MKVFCRHILWITFLWYCFSLAGESAHCDPLVSKPFDYHLRDEHNSKLKAKIITTDSVIQGHIYPKRDHDFYMITLPSAGILRVRHSNLDANIASAIKIHNEGKTEQRWQNGEQGQAQLVTCPIRVKGIYYIEVADTKDTNYSEKPYVLEVSFQPAIDEAEPNDTPLTATQIELPLTFSGKIFPPSDVDRFRFYIREKGCLKILLTGIDHKAGSRIKLANSNGIKVTGEGSSVFSPRAGGWIREEKPGFQKLLINVNESGSYIFSLGQITDFISPLDYRLRLEFHGASNDRQEPNDSPLKAYRIYPGETIEGYILPASDKDYYRIKLKGFGKLYAGVSYLKGQLKPSINVFSASGITSLTGGWIDKPEPEKTDENQSEDKKSTTPLPVSDPQSDKETHFVEVPIERWGEYIVAVGAKDADTASVDPYKLHCIFVNKQKGMPGYPRVEGRIPIR